MFFLPGNSSTDLAWHARAKWDDCGPALYACALSNMLVPPCFLPMPHLACALPSFSQTLNPPFTLHHFQ